MDSAFSTAIPNPSLAAIAQLSENSRLGFASRNTALHQGIEWSKSTLALGLPEWSGKTASDHVVAANNGPQQPKPPLTPQQQHAQQQELLNKKCAAANMASGALWVTAGMNEGAAWLTGGITPFSAIFHGIALGEGIAAGGMSIYAGYVCYQATQ